PLRALGASSDAGPLHPHEDASVAITHCGLPSLLPAVGVGSRTRCALARNTCCNFVAGSRTRQPTRTDRNRHPLPRRNHPEPTPTATNRPVFGPPPSASQAECRGFESRFPLHTWAPWGRL